MGQIVLTVLLFGKGMGKGAKLENDILAELQMRA
jgi:hypothetical protein